MHTNSMLVSLLTSGLATAAHNSYINPVDCAPPAVAYTTPAHTVSVHSTPAHSTPAHTNPITTTLSVEQYGSPHAPPPVPHPNSRPMEHTPASSRVSGKMPQTSSYPQYTSMHTASIPKTGTHKTTMPAVSAAPTYGTVQSVASHLDARGILIVTVVAGLVYFM